MTMNEIDQLFSTSLVDAISQTEKAIKINENEIEDNEDYLSANDFTGSCPQCNSELIWANDFDGEDIGLDLVETIVSFWSCSHCDEVFGFVRDMSE